MLEIIFQKSHYVFRASSLGQGENTTREINSRLFEVLAEVLYKCALELPGGTYDTPSVALWQGFNLKVL